MNKASGFAFLSRLGLPGLLGLIGSMACPELRAGPVTTVPWNGHTGAVSFTYDDARSSQIPNLLPQLDALGIKATFFISVTGAGGDFEARKPASDPGRKERPRTGEPYQETRGRSRGSRSRGRRVWRWRITCARSIPSSSP